jgi:hypothetical protein
MPLVIEGLYFILFITNFLGKLALEPIDQYDFSNLNGYRFVNQGIFRLLTLLSIIISNV